MRIHSKLISAVLLTAGLLVGQPSAHAQIQGSWPTTPGTTTPVTYAWDGLNRMARIHLPPNYSASGSYAVVVAMHGGGGTASHFETLTSYSTKSDAEDFIVVYPQDVSNTGNASHYCCGSAQSQNVDDVDFLRNLVTDMLSAYPIDPGKVFATGHSNGGVMTWRLGCDAADLFVGPNAADSGHLHDPEGANPDCDLGGNKVSVVNLHGDNDSNIPYYGAGSGAEPYVRQPVEAPVTDPQNPINQLYGEQTDIGLWTGLNGCAFVPPVDVDTQTGYEKTTWCAAGSGMQVVNYRMIGDGHVWFTTPNSALSTTDVTWAFFGREIKGGQESLMEGLVSACP